jgi:hypothetical protein
MGLQFPVVVDYRFEVGRAFGINGTPTAVLLDAHGRVASDVASGADAVLTLLRGQDPVHIGGVEHR